MSGASKSMSSKHSTLTHLGDLAVITGLLGVAAATHGPVFGGLSGYVAALGGVLLGALVAGAAARWRWNLLETALASVFVYLLAGGALALPQTTTARVVPTLATLQGLVVGGVQAWKDLLTLTPPAGVFTGPGVVPFMASLVCSVLAATIALRASRPGWALAPVVLLAVIGIAWGSQSAPVASLLGAVLAAGGAAWGSWLTHRGRSASAAGIVAGTQVGSARRRKARTLVGASVVLLAALGVSTLGAPVLDPAGHRAVLRDHVTPPLDLSSYASPLTSYRYWMDDKKDDVLFTVSGLEEGQRVRLATLDAYDGVVMRVGDADDGEGFHRVGAQITEEPLPPDAQTTRLGVEIVDYTGYWVPGGGQLRSLEVTSADAEPIETTLYYSSLLETALTTRGLTKGDAYTVEAVKPLVWSDAQLSGIAFSTLPQPTDQEVPKEVAERLPEFLGEEKGGVEAVRALAQSFSTIGFYSDGSDNLSLASHSSARLSKFLDPDALMVGDDEQYAVAMALMARHAGYPARVVLGFYPETYTGATQEITGTNAHAWVEVSFSGVGWVAFDPTPPRDKTPQTELPEPKPNPRPQVIQPPVPPQEPADLNPDIDDDQQDDKEEPFSLWPWLVLGMKVLGGVLLVASPFLLVMALKALRRGRRRRAKEPLARVTGAWDELVDRASDLRLEVPVGAPRAEQAAAIGAPDQERGRPVFRPVAEPGSVAALAQQVDGAVFAGGDVDSQAALVSWQDMDQALRQLRQGYPRSRRLRAVVSLRSLHRRAWRGGPRPPRRHTYSPRPPAVPGASTSVSTRAQREAVPSGASPRQGDK